MSEPRVTSGAGNRHADVHWEQAARDLVTNPSGCIPAPGTSVGVVGRVSKSCGNTRGFTDLLVGAKSRLPIIDAGRPLDQNLPWIEEIGHAQIEIDISNRFTNTAREVDFGRGLRRQLDAHHCHACVQLAECEFDGGANRWLMVGLGCPAVNVVSCEARTNFIFQFIFRLIWPAFRRRRQAAASKIYCAPRIAGRFLSTYRTARDYCKRKHGGYQRTHCTQTLALGQSQIWLRSDCQRLAHKLWDWRQLIECLRVFSYIAGKTYKHSLKF